MRPYMPNYSSLAALVQLSTAKSPINPPITNKNEKKKGKKPKKVTKAEMRRQRGTKDAWVDSSLSIISEDIIGAVTPGGVLDQELLSSEAFWALQLDLPTPISILRPFTNSQVQVTPAVLAQA